MLSYPQENRLINFDEQKRLCAIAQSAERHDLNQNLNVTLNRSSIPELQSKVSYFQALGVTVP
jgi:hypothetical protein